MRNWISRPFAVALMFCFAAAAEPPSPPESDAFLKTYSFEVLKAVFDETLVQKVQAGQLTKTDAECVSGNIEWDELYSAARPAVSEAFGSSEELKAATKFFASPTGKKISTFGARTLSNFLRAQARGERPQPAPALPPSFTQKDIELAAAFNSSRAGQAFARFVNDGLPKLTKTNLLQPALAKCKSNE